MYHRPMQDHEFPDPESDGDEPALIPCPECGAEIFDDAEQCPQCGSYVERESASMLPWRPWQFVALGILAVFAYAVLMRIF